MKRFLQLRWFIWLFTALFYFYEYLLRVSPSVMVPELMESFHIKATTVGLISAFYLYAYAPMQLPVGVLMDRYGAKKLLTFASAICGIGSFFFAFSGALWLACLGRLLIGVGSAFAFVGIIFVCSHWFHSSKLALLVGLGNSVGMLGAYAGQGPLSMTVAAVGWRYSMSILGIIGLVLALFIYLVIRKAPSSQETETKPQSFSDLMQNLKLVCTNINTWINSIVALLIYITTTALAGLWGIPFLQLAYGMSNELASFAMSMIFIGWLIGGPTMGWVSDRLQKRRLIIMLSIVLTLVFLLPVIYWNTLPTFWIFVFLFLVGFFSSAQLLNFSLAIEINNPQAKGSAAAMTNFTVAAAGSIMQPLIGYLLDLSWDGKTTSNNIPIFSLDDYHLALITLPISLVLALIISFFLKEKTEVHCKTTTAWYD